VHTYLLSDDAIRRYGLDFVRRLEKLGKLVPRIWFSVGISGDKIAAAIAQQSAGSPGIPKEYVRVGYNRKEKEVRVRDDDRIPENLRDIPILIIDAAVHSGASMRHVADELTRRGANIILSYSLIVKKTSEFIPNYFGMLIDEHDRVFFQLPTYPNNRLRNQPPLGCLRALREDDVNHQPNTLNVGLASLDKMSFGDLWYSVKTQNSNVYVYEVAGKVVAYVHFKYQNSGKLFLDAICCDKSVQGDHLGSLLMRWVESFARSSKCSTMELWSIDNRVEWYKERGYEAIAGEHLDLGGGETYTKMRRRILYNVKPLELVLAVD
jgi:hypothetical protein